MVLPGEAQKHGFETKKAQNETNNLKIEPRILKNTSKKHWKLRVTKNKKEYFLSFNKVIIVLAKLGKEFTPI